MTPRTADPAHLASSSDGSVPVPQEQPVPDSHEDQGSSGKKTDNTTFVTFPSYLRGLRDAVRRGVNCHEESAEVVVAPRASIELRGRPLVVEN